MINATLHQSLVLPCPSEGYPPPIIHWTTPSGLNPENYRVDTSGDLTVFSADAQTIGTYTCVATNDFGSDSGQIEVTVKGWST